MSENTKTAAQRLRSDAIAIKLRVKRFGMRRSLTEEQRDRAASEFSALPEFLTARKKLLDNSHPKIREVARVLASAGVLWRSVSVPYPEDGVRLMRRERVAEWEAGMGAILDELTGAIDEADKVYQSELLPLARESLQDLFNEDDYPQTLTGEWGLSWEYPSVEPPDYLRDLAPEVYESERARVASRFEEAVKIAEATFTNELAEMVASLADRLTPNEVSEWERQGEALDLAEAEAAYANDPENYELRERYQIVSAKAIESIGDVLRLTNVDGKKISRKFASAADVGSYLRGFDCRITGSHEEQKSFKATTVTNLARFFERFKSLNVGSSAELDRLVEEARDAVAGVDAVGLRSDTEDAAALRVSLRGSMANISTQLDAMLIDRPRRAIDLE